MNEPTRDVFEPASAERRRLTLLFTDLAGYTALGRIMEAEAYGELPASLRRIWRDAAHKHGGRVVRSQGDGALIVFGIPHAGEEDGRRAAEAAIDIHRWVGQLQPDGAPLSHLPLRMHSGIHAGTVLLSDGDIERGRFDLSGDVVNTTAHLSKQAGAGQILASLDALGPHANFFELGPAAVADPGGPQLRQVLARGVAARRFDATARRGLTPFIGRADALGSLTRFLDETTPDAQRCFVVQGGPGLGKTRLVEELPLHRNSPVNLVLRGSCEGYLGAEVLQPFLQMVRTCFPIRVDSFSAATASPGPSEPAWIAELGDSADTARRWVSADAKPLATRTSASGIVGDLSAFFIGLSTKRRVLLVIDDWQWADDASRQLLQALLHTPAGPRFVIATRPRDEGGDWVVGAPHLALQPFDASETEVAVRRLLAQADPFLIERIHAYAGGVPLFVEELCHSVSADQLLRAIEGRGATQGWLATLVISRLGRLPPDQAEVVRAASVVGNIVPHALLASACEPAPSAQTLQALADADFLHDDPTGNGLRFNHGITRDAVYDAIGLRERTALHRRIVTALLAGPAGPADTDREDAFEALAYHCRGAGEWEGAARYAELAGDKAAAAFALDRARVQYQSAMDALNRNPSPTREQSLRWCLLVNKLGMICIFDPLSLDNDLSVFERALALARSLGDADAVVRAQYWLAYLCYGFGRFRAAVTHARAALEGARGLGDQRLAAQVEATLGQILTATCQYEEATALMDNAVNAKQQRGRRGGGIAIGSAYTLACKGSLLADRGDFPAAHGCFDEALALLGGSTHPVANSTRNWVAVAFAWQGRWADAERIAAESARIAENTRALLLLVMSRAVGGYSRWSATHDSGGLQQVRDAMHWMETRRGQFYISLHHGWLVEALLAEGDVAGARRSASIVMRRALEGERLGEAVSCRALADAAVDRGDVATARRWLKRANHCARLRGSPREAALNQASDARLLWHTGRPDEARRAAQRAVDALRALGMAWHAARVEAEQVVRAS